MRKQNLVTRRHFIERSETTDKSYPGDNRLVRSESSYRRSRSAPRCRLALARGWRRFQACGCSPLKRARELGSDRRETGRSLSAVSVKYLREVVSSKNLLLHEVIRDENAANNGGILVIFGSLIIIDCCGPAFMIQFT